MSENRCLEQQASGFSLASPPFRFVLETDRIADTDDVRADITCDQQLLALRAA